jgi:hemin uptake protein HemP
MKPFLPHEAPKTAAAELAPGRAVRRYRSAELLAGETEIIIEHHGREYRLRLTQNGKLILTA